MATTQIASAITRWPRFFLLAQVIWSIAIEVSDAGIAAFGDVLPTPLISNSLVEVGNASFGQVTIDGGSALDSLAVAIGGGSTSGFGVAQISGVGSVWSTGLVQIGARGTGQLEILDGGLVRADSVNMRSSYGGFADVTVSGAGSELRVDSTLFGGRNGPASMRLVDGGMLSIRGGFIEVGEQMELDLSGGTVDSLSFNLKGELSGDGLIASNHFVSDASSSIFVDHDEDLTISSTVRHRGRLEVDDGRFTVLGPFDNATGGKVTLRNAELRVLAVGQDGIGNQSTLVTFGNSNHIIGNFSNSRGGSVAITNNSQLRIHGNVGSGGLISMFPGSRASISGDLVLNGQYHFLLSGSDNDEYGKVEVVGDLEMGGTLMVTLSADYSPALGDRFELISASGRVDHRISLHRSLPLLQEGLAWTLSQDVGALVLSVDLAGDYNGDSIVDSADYAVWRDALGASEGFPRADGSGPLGVPDGVVDVYDYSLWKSNFGRTAPAALRSVGATIPEPSSWVAMLLGMVAYSAWQLGLMFRSQIYL